jgi:hypothetical protein
LRSKPTVFSTPTARAVALADADDFTVNDVLSSVPSNVTQTLILLIRNEAGVWFAASIPLFFE